MLVLDSGGVTRLARRDRQAAALVDGLRRAELWPPVVPSVVLVESLTGQAGRDANVNRLVKACDVAEQLPWRAARRAADLRRRAGTGSAVDAVAVALAEPGGTVLTGDTGDLQALADHAVDVAVQRV